VRNWEERKKKHKKKAKREERHQCRIEGCHSTERQRTNYTTNRIFGVRIKFREFKATIGEFFVVYFFSLIDLSADLIQVTSKFGKEYFKRLTCGQNQAR
jgi:hypothetical protein